MTLPLMDNYGLLASDQTGRSVHKLRSQRKSNEHLWVQFATEHRPCTQHRTGSDSVSQNLPPGNSSVHKNKCLSAHVHSDRKTMVASMQSDQIKGRVIKNEKTRTEPFVSNAFFLLSQFNSEWRYRWPWWLANGLGRCLLRLHTEPGHGSRLTTRWESWAFILVPLWGSSTWIKVELNCDRGSICQRLRLHPRNCTVILLTLSPLVLLRVVQFGF